MEEEGRTKTDKERILKSKETVEEDNEREKNIVLEAQTNERRLDEEKNVLIDTEKKYYDIEKKTGKDLQIATENLKKEQNILENLTKDLTLNNEEKKFINYLNDINQNLDNAKNFINENENTKARNVIDDIIISIKDEANRLKSSSTESSVNYRSNK